MNISVYAFGQFEMGYSQYPDDYTGDIFTEFYKHSKAKTQIAIHRDGSLMYYGYIRKLEQNRYIGLCAVVNGQMFVQIKPLFSMFEGIIEEMVEKEQLIQMGNYGEVTTKASSLYLKENDIKELSNKLRRQLENQNCITMPPINNSVSKDSIQNFNLEDDSNQIIQSIGKYGYTYIYKSNGYDTDRLKGFSEKIFQLNKEHEEALEEIRKLKKTSRKIIDRDSESTYKGLIWLLLGVIVILFIVIALSKKDQEINDDSNETTTPVATSEESYNSYLNSTNNSIVKEDDDSEPKEEREYVQLKLKNNTIHESVKKEKYGYEKDKIFPTDIGIVVNDYLQDNFDGIMDYGFTANVEKEFDDIAEGKVKWQEMINNFYGDFHHSIEDAITYSTKASGERLLGSDPKTNANVYAKLGKYGPMVQIGENYEDEKPRYARMKSTQSIESITLEEALDLFKLPKTLGEYEGDALVIGIGRFGPYVKYHNSFVSIPKGEEPTEITYERAIELIELKKKADQDHAPRLLGEHEGKEVYVAVGKYGPYLKYDGKNITLNKGTVVAEMVLEDAVQVITGAQSNNVLASFKENPDIKVMNGRYGAYLTDGTNNYKLPKGRVPENLTYDDCMEIISNTTPTAKKTSYRRKK